MVRKTHPTRTSSNCPCPYYGIKEMGNGGEMRTRFMLFMIVLTFLGCSVQADEKEIKEKFIRTVQEPLQQFKTKWGGESKIEPKQISSGDFKCVRLIPNDKYSYNITKTNSIVSPYIGKVTFYGNLLVKEGKSREECLKAPWTEAGKIEAFEFTYAYQDGKWTFKNQEISASLLKELGKWQ